MMQISEKSVNTFFYCATIRATIGKRNEKVIFNQRITSFLFHYFYLICVLNQKWFMVWKVGRALKKVKLLGLRVLRALPTSHVYHY